jgi:hypothetical protein
VDGGERLTLPAAVPPAAFGPALPPGKTIFALLATGAVATLAAQAFFTLRDRRAKRVGPYVRTTGP